MPVYGVTDIFKQGSHIRRTASPPVDLGVFYRTEAWGKAVKHEVLGGTLTP